MTLSDRSSNFIGALVASIVACLTLLSLDWAIRPSLNLYEPDIYKSIPSLAWATSFSAMVFPILVFALSVGRKTSSQVLTTWLVLAFVCANVGFLSIPLLRYPSGYDRWDSWYHLAEVKAILLTGHVSESNFYPAMHTLLSITSTLTGLSPGALFRAFPVVVACFILGATHFGCKWIGIDYKGSFVGVVAVSSLLGLPISAPLSFSVPILLLVVALFIRGSPGTSQAVLVTVFFSALVITHLLTALACVIGLFGVSFLSGRKKHPLVHTVTLLGVMTVAWIFLMTRVFESPIRLMEQIVTTGTFRGRGYLDVLAGVGLTGVSAILVITAILLPRLAMISMSLPATKAALVGMYRRLPSPEATLGLWAVSNSFVLIGLGSLFGTGALGDIFDRFAIYGLYALVFLSALSFERLLVRNRKRAAVSLLVLSVVLVAGQAAFFYPAPITARYNWETGATDVDGLAWIGRYGVPGSSFAGSTYNHAILSGLIGVDNASAVGLAFGMTLPKHLGCAAQPEPKSRILIVTAFDFYVLGRRGELSPTDFTCVASSGQYDTLYDNGAFWILSTRET